MVMFYIYGHVANRGVLPVIHNQSAVLWSWDQIACLSLSLWINIQQSYLVCLGWIYNTGTTFTLDTNHKVLCKSTPPTMGITNTCW